MKPLSTLAFTILFIANTALSAQNTTTWFPSGAKWTYSFGSLNGNGEEYFDVVGQEMVGGELCAKLHYYGFISNWIFMPFDNGFKYFFARNDSVFLWNGNAFNLLYDFKRKAGDTFLLPIGNYDFGIVQNIGDTIWNGIPVRFQDLSLGRINPLTQSDTFYQATRVYERLGGSHLIFWNIESPLTEIEYTLECYSDLEYPQVDCPFGFDPTYVSFPQYGTSVWSETDGSWCSFRGYQFRMTTDTIISGVGLGKKVYFRNTYQGSSPCPIGSTEIIHEPFQLVGLLKQDIQHEKVYYARLTDNPASLPICVEANSLPINQFQLLYDFKLRPGDTVSWKPEPNVVLKVDSIQLDNGTWRRTLVFDTLSKHFWIEGIGSNVGLLGAFANTQISDQSCNLQCFRYNNQVLYSTVDAIFCDSIAVGTHEPNGLDQALRLFPNPNSGIVHLQIPQDQTPAQLRVFDVLGRELEKLEVLEVNSQINLSRHTSNAMLMIQIQGASGQIAGRVLRLE